MSDRREDRRREQPPDDRRGGRDTRETEDTMSDGGAGTTQTEPRERPPSEEEPVSRVGTWFATAAMRWGVILFGIVLMLFALGQAAGTNILGPILDAMTSQTGIWLLVALFALALIAAAIRIQ